MEVGRKMWARFRFPNLGSQSDDFARTSFLPLRLPERWDFLNLEAAISHQRTLSSSSSRLPLQGIGCDLVSTCMHHAAQFVVGGGDCFGFGGGLPGSRSCEQELSSERGAAGVVTDHPTLLSGCTADLHGRWHACAGRPPLFFTASRSPALLCFSPQYDPQLSPLKSCSIRSQGALLKINVGPDFPLQTRKWIGLGLCINPI